MLDLAVRDGLVVDGTGTAPVEADIGIEGDAIVEIGKVGPARRVLDAGGFVVAPGFVDAHTHDDMHLCRDPHNRYKLLQGVTTVVCGSCGFSAFPHRPGDASPDFLAVDGPWRSYSDYAQTLTAQGVGPNMAAFVGHNTLLQHAASVSGSSEPRSLSRFVVDGVRRAVEQGALGVSTGLIYEPGRYSATEDLVETARAAAELGGIYSTHIRDEGDGLLPAIEEALTIGQESGAGVQISHLKAAGPRNWGSVGAAVEIIDSAWAAGQDVAFDVYPYAAGSGPMEQYFDPADVDVERAELVSVTRCWDYPNYEGRLLAEIARTEGIDLGDLTRRIITAPRSTETICVIFEIDEDDMRSVLSHPRAMVGSDGIPQEDGVPHPRLLGTFPRVLGEYSRDQALFDLPSAVRKMTSLAAVRYGLVGRGQISPGASADLTVFDYETIRDCGSYERRRHPQGVRWVVVNGVVAVTPDGISGALPGRVLLKSET